MDNLGSDSLENEKKRAKKRKRKERRGKGKRQLLARPEMQARNRPCQVLIKRKEN